MGTKPLTARTVETARPRYNADSVAVRTEMPDGANHGLRLVLFPTGRRSWIVRYRFQGRQRKLTLPGFFTLAEARKAVARRCWRWSVASTPPLNSLTRLRRSARKLPNRKAKLSTI